MLQRDKQDPERPHISVSTNAPLLLPALIHCSNCQQVSDNDVDGRYAAQRINRNGYHSAPLQLRSANAKHDKHRRYFTTIYRLHFAA